MKRLLTALLLLLPLATIAHEESKDHYDRVNLSASATGRVDNDTIVATLYAQAEGSQAAALADEVNKRINWGVQQLKKYQKIKVQTQSYNTYPIYTKSNITGWRVRQSFRMESQDMALVSNLLGDLQSKLALENVSFSVSPEQRNSAENTLIEEALAAFETRAKLIAKSLGRSNYVIAKINVNTSGGNHYPQPHAMMRMSSMSESVAAPQMQAGESSLTVNVSGEIEVQ